MPPADTPQLLTDAPLGTMTNGVFCQRCIQPGMADPNTHVVPAWTHVGNWFQTACTLATVGGADINCLSVLAANPATPQAADMIAVGA